MLIFLLTLLSETIAKAPHNQTKTLLVSFKLTIWFKSNYSEKYISVITLYGEWKSVKTLI